MSQVNAIRERMSAVVSEIKTLGEADERSADQESRLDALLTEINELGPRLEREQIL